jgi:signal transduction histidine kinase
MRSVQPTMQAAEVVAEVLGRLDDDAPPRAFYDQLCEAVCRVARVERAVVFLYDRALRRTRAAGAHGLDPGLFEEAYVTPDTAPVARMALEEDRVVEVGEGDRALQVPEAFVPLLRGRRLACAPMVAAGRWIGVLLVDRRADDAPLNAGERDVLWTLGKASALAATAQIGVRQAERARQLQHRIDLAREVHDGVVQRLFGVSLALAGEGPLGAEERARCAEEVQAALAELRDVVQRPLGREPRATAATFVEAVARLREAHPELRIAWEREAEVPEGLEAVTQSALEEAVRNARKHADPSSVAVRTCRDDGAFVLEVRNDGAHTARTAGATGMGLRLLAFEALRLGGVLEFGPQHGGTWTVRLVVPADG